MKNEWITPGFLILLITALVTLAVLQYCWVGSISDSEKDRLQETLSASAENFVAGFNRNFRELHQAFSLQITSEDVDWSSEIENAFENWLSIAEYPDLIDAVYFIENVSSEQPDFFVFRSDLDSLEHTGTEFMPSIHKRMNLHWHMSIDRNRPIPLYTGPALGNPSFLFIPVQFLDILSLANVQSGRNDQLRLNVKQSDNGVFIKLDDDIVKTRLIPGLAKIYFSDSYENQYHLSITHSGGKDSSYYTNATNNIPPPPDVKIPIQWSNGQNLFTYRSNLPGNRTIGAFRSSGDKFLSRSEGNTSVHRNFSEPAWELWLTVTEGSLDALVNQTRTRNLMISFGILLTLGISGGMIVLYARRSKELSYKQMLFVAGVSHELRTPIAVIRSAAENLSKGFIKSETRRNEYAHVVLNESLRLGNMVDQIMEFSGIQSGKKTYHFTEGLLSDFSIQIQSAVQPMLTEKSMTLECILTSSRQSLYADWESVFVAVMNLVQNAVKFSPEYSKIQFVIKDTEWKGNKAVQFTIKDDGSGIPEKEQEKIFEPFYRTKSAIEEQIKGNGIGLNLVLKIAEAHGGGINVQSEEGSGSTFQLIIPVNKYLS